MSNDYDPNYQPQKQCFIVGGKVLIFNSNNQLLLMKRSDKVEAGGKWSVPGGAVESNENTLESLRREIKEETNLIVSDINTFAVNTHIGKDEESTIIIGYVAQLHSGEVELNWEHDDYAWVTCETAFDYELTSDAHYFISEYQKVDAIKCEIV